MDTARFETVLRAFNPYTPGSGTENIGPLLYSLARVGHYETVTEFGSGFTTPFLAAALADNYGEYLVHRKALVERIATHRELLDKVLENPLADTGSVTDGDRRIQETIFKSLGPILLTNGPPVAPNPLFYSTASVPHLFTWEPHDESHPYVETLRNVLETLQVERFVTVFTGATIEGHLRALPDSRRPIDMAWNDWGHKTKFFDEIYPELSPAGGILVFHSPTEFEDQFDVIRTRLRGSIANGTCELMTFIEPHKCIQDGCVIVRKCEQQRSSIRTSLKRSLEMLRAL